MLMRTCHTPICSMRDWQRGGTGVMQLQLQALEIRLVQPPVPSVGQDAHQ